MNNEARHIDHDLQKNIADAATNHFSLFTDFDIDLFKAGKHYALYHKLGAHFIRRQDDEGVYFAVWAPNARRVSLIGNFNNWNKEADPMQVRWDGSGIWEIYVSGLQPGEYYKYHIISASGYIVEKADPYGFHQETPPASGSIVWDLSYNWCDADWLKRRKNIFSNPFSIYELHIGSWRRKEENQSLTYRELAAELPSYLLYLGFTHVEFMPVMEHPFYGSWGYQLTGFFAPSARYGTPQDFMFLVDALHQAGIGVLLDWVPSHFPVDEHGLGFFDGTHLYEHDDPRRGFHQDWQSLIFNYGRNEVREFLISNALHWLDQYHVDGLRVDAVASMLYLDYSRKEGEWLPNEHGGRENLEAISFLQELNDAVHKFHPDTVMIAEESTAWDGVTRAVAAGGLGFDFKWMMGWMHDTLSYFQKDAIYRSHHQGQLAFSIYYVFSERFMLPLSHDEVVYGKKSLIEKMPGDEWQKFANLRLLFGYMYAHPGAKLIFMGGEFGQHHEWRHDYSLDWHEAELLPGRGIQLLLKDLNALYKKERALYELGYSSDGFEWIDFADAYNSVFAWLRKSGRCDEQIVFVANFTPVVRNNYRIGVPARGYYYALFNSDDKKFGGSGITNQVMETAPIPYHGRTHSLSLTLPPLAIIAFKKQGEYYI